MDHEWLEDVSLLIVKLVIKLIVGASSQLGLLSVGMILGLGTGKTVWPSLLVLERDLEDEQPL